jgi:hypothetical protein
MESKMKILCGLSSITFNCEHFPGFLTQRETYHPVFSIPQKKLLSYLGKWGKGELTPTDSYLLFLSLLNSTDLVDFRVPAIQVEETPSIVANNMEALAKTVSKLNTVQNPSVVFPRYVITPDTKNLTNVKYWIQNWNDAYQDFVDGYSRTANHQELARREVALERLIKNPHKPVSSYATNLADWAIQAGSFPTFTIVNPFSALRNQITCAEYWKILIQKCANEESIFAVRRTDLEELLDHCEDNIPVGSIFSNALFKVLRHALNRQKNFLGLGDLDIGKSSYEILSSTDNVESANLKALIQSAPEHEPKQEEYPNKLAYLKAKLRYQMSLKYANSEIGE